MYSRGVAVSLSFPVKKVCCIQENRHKVEQFHFLWFTVPQFVEERPNNVEQLQKGEQVLKGGHYPQIVEQFHKKGTAPLKSSMLFGVVEQSATLNCVSHGSASSHKLLFRIIVVHLVLCKSLV